MTHKRDDIDVEFNTTWCIDTAVVVEYYRNGGIRTKTQDWLVSVISFKETAL